MEFQFYDIPKLSRQTQSVYFTGPQVTVYCVALLVHILVVPSLFVPASTGYPALQNPFSRPSYLTPSRSSFTNIPFDVVFIIYVVENAP